MKVLIADDEKILVNMLKEILRKNKIDCDAVNNGSDAVEYAAAGEYDLIILDIMMPKLNGYEALKEIRRSKNSAPVLMLSAKSEIADKVEGLDFGADDYLTKPFAASELVARINALTRRKGEYVGEVLQFSDLTLDKRNFVLCCGESRVKLSNTEYKIMEILIKRPQTVINKDKIIEKVWGWDDESDYNNAEVYISFLRKKLAAIKSKVTVRAVRGVGYSLECVNE